MSILPATEGIGISWGVQDSRGPKHLKKCMKLNWNFQKSGEVLEKNSLPRGMNIFWNCTFSTKCWLSKCLYA